MRHLTIGCLAMTLVACGGGDRADSAAAVDTMAAMNTASAMPGAPPAGGMLADMAGRWSGRATPESGTDTTPTMLTIVATGDTTGWMMELPGRPPMPMRVHVMGDSIMSEVGPYESVRRKGVQVTTQTTMRRQGDRLVGTTVARYQGAGADSVLRLRMEATRSP
jgi:hypothetical protein